MINIRETLSTRIGQALAMTAALTLMSCGNPHQATAGSVGSLVDAKISRALAYDCKSKCPSLLVEFEVKNNSTELYCLPAIYRTEGAADHVSVIDRKSGQVAKATRSPGLPPEGAVGDNSDFAGTMLKQDNIVLQPGSSATMIAGMDDYFDIALGGADVELDVIFYPCLEEKLKSVGQGQVRVRSSVTYQSADSGGD